MSSRWTGFFLWALVAASTAFWGIKIFAATRPVPPGAQAPQAVAANGPMERLFGAVAVQSAAAAPAHPESERFQLVGVIAAPDGGVQGGYAIVSIDTQPARPWHVGATLDGNTTLLSVTKRGAEFGPSGGPTAFSLQLPEPAAAETGTLTAAVSQPDPAQQVAPQLAVPQMAVPQMAVPQGENAQHVAQPPVLGRGGFPGAFPGPMPGRGGPAQAGGRGGFQGGVAPPRTPNPTPPEATPPLQK